MKLLIHTIAFNRKDLLEQMINSIDIKIDYDIMIHIHSKDSEILEYLAQFNDNSKFIINNIGFNRGVSEAWNDALEYGFESKQYDRIFFVNSDIKFGPGDIDKMISFSEAKPDKLITVCGSHGKHKDWDQKNLSHGFACAILPPTIFNEIGYFDENFFPAYNEDCDYFTRLWHYRGLGPIKPGYDKISAKDSPIVECLLTGKTHHEGSSVIYSSSYMMQINSQTHAANNRYYLGKWGGLNDHEKYEWPFDEEMEAGYKTAVYTGKTQRHNPYPEFWDRNKEKQKYYQSIK